MICDYEELPYRIGGFIKETCEPDGDYLTVVLNSRLSFERLCETYSHEIEHINNNDIYKEGSVNEIERMRHK
jgi:hypothetical protein